MNNAERDARDLCDCPACVPEPCSCRDAGPHCAACDDAPNGCLVCRSGPAALPRPQGGNATSSAPDPAWVRGVCPMCGEPVVSNSYYVGGKGYLIVWQCWQSLGASPTCDYRRVL